MIRITQEEIMKNWNVKNTETPLVSIKCMAYNQDKYIAQTIDGFLLQKTTFPFEILIHDDASTDDTSKIIQEYVDKFPLIIKPIFENENQYSKGDDSHHKKIDAAIKGKYLATCEGDDYWIDEKKLQKQVTFLEKHIEYGACYSKAIPYFQEKGIFGTEIGDKKCSFEEIMIYGNSIPNLTSVVKTDLLKLYEKEIQPGNKGWLLGDLPKWLWIARKSKIHFIPKITSVYRVLQESASHFIDENKQKAFNQSCVDIRTYFEEIYNTNGLVEQHLAHFGFIKAWNERNRNLILEYSENLPKNDWSIKVYLKIFLAKNEKIYNKYLILKGKKM